MIAVRRGWGRGGFFFGNGESGGGGGKGGYGACFGFGLSVCLACSWGSAC
jgi:hypothetical protein